MYLSPQSRHVSGLCITGALVIVSTMVLLVKIGFLVITRISIRPSLTERDDELKVLLAQSRETDTILVKSQPNLNLITTHLLLPRLDLPSILLSGETC